jgi:folate-binding protein YgfZ
LTPQGKILFDFFVVHAGKTMLIDCAVASANALRQRLGFYKLRADVAIEDAPSGSRVAAIWGDGAGARAKAQGVMTYEDPRFPALGWRLLLDPDAVSEAPEGEADYEAMRIGLAVPECGKDYAIGDSFPHEACLDLLHGVDFGKGCYVGQEVVSRMQHRGTARTRVVGVSSERGLPEGGANLVVDDFPIGRLGSVAGNHGIALARLDRAREAIEEGREIRAQGIQVRLTAPAWANYSLAVAEAAS